MIVDATRALFLGSTSVEAELRSKARSEAQETLAAVYIHAGAQELLEALRPILAAVEEDAQPKEKAVVAAEAALVEAHKQEALATAAYWTAKATDANASPDVMSAAGAKVHAEEARVEEAKREARASAIDLLTLTTGRVPHPELKLAADYGRLRAKEIRQLVESLEQVPEPDLSVLARYLGKPCKTA